MYLTELKLNHTIKIGDIKIKLIKIKGQSRAVLIVYADKDTKITKHDEHFWVEEKEKK